MIFEDGLACSIRCMPHVQALKMLLGTTTLKVFRAAHNALGDAGAQAGDARRLRSSWRVASAARPRQSASTLIAVRSND